MNPNDTVIVADAHKYLLDHFQEFDFIWSSPPCPTHSKARFAIAKGTDFELHPSKQRPAYPEMSLYQEILFLKHYFTGKWIVENVISFYEPLIQPITLGGHYFWTNVYIPNIEDTGTRLHTASVEELAAHRGFNLDDLKGIDKRLALRDTTEPHLARYLFDFIEKPIETTALF